MKIVYPHKGYIGTSVLRKQMAQLIAATIERGTHNEDHIPYEGNRGDDSFWHVDSGNDWYVRFDESGTSMEIRHRYHNKPATEAISTWIAYRTGGCTVDADGVIVDVRRA